MSKITTSFTFLIITYRRPEKVKRLLIQFLDTAWLEIINLNLEIIIADDHSNDNTKDLIRPIIEDLIIFGWNVKYIYRETNVKGDYNLYKGLVNDSSGEYIWLLCDDDCLVINESINFIRTVFLYKPIIAICGFKQGNFIKYGNNLGNKIRMSKSFEDSIELISHYPKTSTYIFKKGLDNLSFEKFLRWNGTLYAWIGLAISMVGNNNGFGVLAYPNITVFADNEYGELRYSYRVFRHLNYVVRDSISLTTLTVKNSIYELPYLQKDDEISLNILGLQAHYSKKTDIRYSNAILRSEIEFFKKNKFSILYKRQRIILASKLIFVYLQNCFNKNNKIES